MKSKPGMGHIMCFYVIPRAAWEGQLLSSIKRTHMSFDNILRFNEYKAVLWISPPLEQWLP